MGQLNKSHLAKSTFLFSLNLQVDHSGLNQVDFISHQFSINFCPYHKQHFEVPCQSNLPFQCHQIIQNTHHQTSPEHKITLILFVNERKPISKPSFSSTICLNHFPMRFLFNYRILLYSPISNIYCSTFPSLAICLYMFFAPL